MKRPCQKTIPLLAASVLLLAGILTAENVTVAPGEKKTVGITTENPGQEHIINVIPEGDNKFKTEGWDNILGEHQDASIWQRTDNTDVKKTFKVIAANIHDANDAVFRLEFEKPEAGGGGGSPPPALSDAYVKAVNCFVKIHKPGTIAAPGALIPPPAVAGTPYYGILLRNTDEDVVLGTEDYTTGSKTGDGLSKDNDLVKVELSWNPAFLRPDMVAGKSLVLELPANTKAYLASGVELTEMSVTIGSPSGQLATLGGSARKQSIFLEGNKDWNGDYVTLKVDALEEGGAESKAKLLPIIINKVGFTAGHDIASDDLSSPYVSPQWRDLDGNRKPDDAAGGEHNYAIAYTKNTKPTISAEMSIPGLPAGVTVDISAVGTDGINIASEPSSTGGSTVTLDPKEASNAFPDKVRFYDRRAPSDPANPASPPSPENGFNLEWKVTFSDIGEMSAGTTTHQAYVTYANPIETENDQVPVRRIQTQEVLFYIGCKGADEKNTEDEIWQGIWAEVSNRVVQRIDKDTGDPTLDAFPNAAGSAGMIYWLVGALLIPRDLDDMLSAGHSTCGTWSVFMQACANTQGIMGHDNVNIEAPEPVDYPKMLSDYRTTYSVPAANSISYSKNLGGGFPPPPSPSDGDILLGVDSNNGYSTHGIFFVKSVSLPGNFIDVPASSAGFPAPSSSPGQGNPNARAWFGNHAIVKYDGKYYDPSYGGPSFPGKIDWEDHSLQHFGALITPFEYNHATSSWVVKNDILWKERVNPAGGPECDINP